MIQSMTGFGRGEAASSVQEGASFRMQVEIKSVNHRYGEVVVRMPKALLVLEERVRRLVSAKLQRGRVDVFISFDEVGSRAANVQVDYELAKTYFQAGRELAAQLGLPQTLTVEQLLRYPDIIKVSEVQEDAENRWPVLQEALEAALAQLLAMRRQEGCNLQEDFARRIALLRERLQTVEARAPQVACEYQEKLLLKLRELLAAAGTAPDESRVLQEAALFADRIGIVEEIVRFRSHLDQFFTTLSVPEPVGRKLDFLLQELNREANTMASKANDFELGKIVVEMKSELEKMREQVQNVE